MIRDNIPDQLAEEQQWVKRIAKKHAVKGWNDPTNWKVLEEIDGDALFCTTGTEYFIIDGDHIIGDGGKLFPEVAEDLKRITKLSGTTYTEKSLSGHGLHMIYDMSEYAGTFEPLSNNKFQKIIYKNRSFVDNDGKTKYACLELWYRQKHLFYFTGNRISTISGIVGGDQAASAMREVLRLIEERCEKPDGSPNEGKEALKLTDDKKGRILEALNAIPVKELEYDDWIIIGQAIYNCGFDFEVFDKWSQDDPRYNEKKEDTTDKKWESFSRTPSKWNAGTIVRYAKKYGWRESNDERKDSLLVENPFIEISELEPTDDQLTQWNDGFSSMADIEEVEHEWLVPGYIPKDEISVLASDGGMGKTTAWCKVIAGLSSGSPTMFDEVVIGVEEFRGGEPKRVLIFSGEAKADQDLKRKLRLSGANMANISVIDLNNKKILDYKFSSRPLEWVIRKRKPDVIVFDPMQSFIAERTRMAERNQMRNEIMHLALLCSEYHITAILVCHTNKRENAVGRDKLADSSDIWDIARSVLMIGETGKRTMEDNEIRYLSHEKSNNGARQPTILFSTPDGVFKHEGITNKRSKDFVLDLRNQKGNDSGAKARNNAKEVIVEFLQSDGGSPKTTDDLSDYARAQSISNRTMERAKSELKKEKRIRYIRGKRGEPWLVCLSGSGNLAE